MALQQIQQLQPIAESDEEASERQPLLYESSSNGSQCNSKKHNGINIEASPLLKLKCLIYALLIIALGFVMTIVETQAFLEAASENLRTTVGWACYAMKCSYLVPAIFALLYLQRGVIVQGSIPTVELQLIAGKKAPATLDTGRLIVLRNVSRCMTLPRGLSSSPSRLFIATSLIFSFFACLSIVIEIACGVIASKGSPSVSISVELSEVCRRLLLLIFIIIQTRFFLLHHQVSVQWKLGAAWFSAAHILAANITAWIINVGFELREVVNSTTHAREEQEHVHIAHELFCKEKSLDIIIRALYPFLIEYYVMSALMTLAFMNNMGKLAGAIRKLATEEALTTESIRATFLSTKSRNRNRSWKAERQMLRNYSGIIGCGIGAVLIALAVAIFVKAYGKRTIESDIAFYCTLIVLYTCSITCNCLLLKTVKKNKSLQKLTTIYKTDRLLLWLGTLAIIINDVFTLWVNCIEKIPNHYHDLELVSRDTLTAVCSAFNISQSLLQVFTLECALVCKLRSKNRSYGQALLTVLMLLNGAQWLFNTICFSFFFPTSKMDDASLVLALLTIPLQVFFRFHSIACIHDFKKHCDDESEQRSSGGQQASSREQIMEIDYPQDLDN